MTRVIRAQLARRVTAAIQGIQETQVPPVLTATLVHQERPAQAETLETQATLDRREALERQVLLVQQEALVPLVRQVPLVPLA